MRGGEREEEHIYFYEEAAAYKLGLCYLQDTPEMVSGGEQALHTE